MPISPVPYVIPSCLTFYLSEGAPAATFCVYNPFPHDILFKVDNAYPKRYTVSLTQGVVSSHQKIVLTLTCTSREASLEDGVQVRFFRWARPRQGHKPRAQQYVGFRTVKLLVYNERSENVAETEGALSEAGKGSGASGSGRGSVADARQASRRGAGGEEVEEEGRPCSERRLYIITNLVGAVTLLVCGFALNRASDQWFQQNIMEGLRPQTLAVVSYTLAFVTLLKLLTFR